MYYPSYKLITWLKEITIHREIQNYEKNEEATKPTEKLEQRFMKEQRKVEKNHLAQQSSWLLSNTHFCSKDDSIYIISELYSVHWIEERKSNVEYPKRTPKPR